MTNLLLVDDDRDDVELFEEAAESLGNNVTCSSAGDGRDALELLYKMTTRPDLIFLDINMPNMDGWTFLSTIKKDDHLKDIPVIMYSTAENPQLLQTAQKLGALCFFTKPDNFKFLQRILMIVQQYFLGGQLNLVCQAIQQYRMRG